MTLKEYIKKYKLSNCDPSVYLALYNKDNKRFYGNFVDSGKLDDYLNMKIISGKKFSDTSSIYCVQLEDYEYSLGLDSMRVIWEKEKQKAEIKKSRKIEY